ncbi:MAG: 4Fe-4S dicluster domain-containing protein [Candidatus Bathyarchaeia archaeon]
MAEETFMGVPRSKIPWSPIIDYQKCDLCGGDPQCLKFCPHDVFGVQGNSRELVVKNPNNCVVFCRSCRKVCPTDALSFPLKSEVLILIQKIREERKAEAVQK